MLRYYIILSVIFLSACQPSDTPINNGLRIVFAGDVLLDRGLRPMIEREGARALFDGVADIFGGADAVVINLECPISDSLNPLHKKYRFRADSYTAPQLREAGITHCGIANNHTVDQGTVGLRESVRNLRKSGITPIGCGISSEERSAPAIIRKGGIEVAIFSACTLVIENYAAQDSMPGIWNVGIEEVCQAIGNFRKRNPDTWIVISIHWGHEFQQATRKQRMEALRLISSGADAIIGHHPHISQRVDTIAGKIVYYSIGNFVFDQRDPLGRKAIMPVLTFSRDSIRHEIMDIEIVGNKPRITR